MCNFNPQPARSHSGAKLHSALDDVYSLVRIHGQLTEEDLSDMLGLDIGDILVIVEEFEAQGIFRKAENSGSSIWELVPIA